MLFLGYAIIQLPEFLRVCYLTIHKFLGKTEDKNNRKSNKIEIEERHIDQTEIERYVDKNIKFKMQNYLDSKFQLLRNFQRVNTFNEEAYVKKSEMNAMITQELDLLMQLTENP